MKSFLDFAKQKENDELKRQVDHLKDMTAEHEEKAQSALMMGDRDGHSLHMAKCNHFKTQHDALKSKMSESVEESIQEATMTGIEIKKSKGKLDPDLISKHDIHYNGKKIGHIEAYQHRSGVKYGWSHHASGEGEAGERNMTHAIEGLRSAHAEHLKNQKNSSKEATKSLIKLSKMKEEIEQIDELDTGTLKRYTKKALSQTMSSAKKGDMETSNKRFAGMSKALDKIKTREPMDTSRSLKNITKNWHKEEVDLDESHVAIAMGKELDDEGNMIMNQLDQIERSIKMLRDTVKDPEMQIPAWVQSKVTLAADYMETVAGYMSSKNEKVSEEVDLEESTPAWQRKEGKSASGGLNRKGIASYRRENPGSKLSMAVTTKPSKLKPGSKAANRRKSFCARMSGMKKRLTSAKTAKDPNSRINKSLRKWNC